MHGRSRRRRLRRILHGLRGSQLHRPLSKSGTRPRSLHGKTKKRKLGKLLDVTSTRMVIEVVENIADTITENVENIVFTRTLRGILTEPIWLIFVETSQRSRRQSRRSQLRSGTTLLLWTRRLRHLLSLLRHLPRRCRDAHSVVTTWSRDTLLVDMRRCAVHANA